MNEIGVIDALTSYLGFLDKSVLRTVSKTLNTAIPREDRNLAEYFLFDLICCKYTNQHPQKNHAVYRVVFVQWLVKYTKYNYEADESEHHLKTDNNIIYKIPMKYILNIQVKNNTIYYTFSNSEE